MLFLIIFSDTQKSRPFLKSNFFCIFKRGITFPQDQHHFPWIDKQNPVDDWTSLSTFFRWKEVLKDQEIEDTSEFPVPDLGIWKKVIIIFSPFKSQYYKVD